MDASQNFTEGRIFPKLIKFMLPVLAALILQAMYGAVDMLIVGQFGTEDGISAVSTGSNLINMITFTFAGFTMGVTVLMGRYLGQKKAEKISSVIGGAVCFFAVVSVVITAATVIFARPMSQLMQAPAAALDSTVTYVVICGAGTVFIMAYNFISSIFRGLGNSKLPLVFVGIACVVNIIGDLLFVAVFKMNVAGAALATVLAQAVSVVLSLLIIRKQKLPFKFSLKDIRFNKEISTIVKIGIPIAIQEFLTQISFMALCAFINNLGLAQSSGYGVANKLIAFIMLIPSSLMQSMAPFVSQNVGAGKEDRAKKTMLTGMAVGCSVGTVIALCSFFFGDYMSMIFTGNAEFIAQSADYLKGFALDAVVTCILFSFIGYYNGHGETLFVMIQGLSQTFLVRLPFSYIMSIQENAGLAMIGLAAPAATVFGICLNLGYYFWYKKRKLNKLL